MILRALYDYCQRCDNIAPEGMEYKEIGFLIVIDKDGAFLRIEDCRIDKNHASEFLVPKTVQRSGSKAGMNPCLLWDNTRFVLGLPKDGKPNPEGQYLDAFIGKVKELSDKYPESEAINSVNHFYQKYPKEDILSALKSDVLYDELIETKKNISFRVQGKTTIVAEDPMLRKEMTSRAGINSDGKICLVTGEKGEISRIHSKTPMPGATFASLVSFQKNQGYDSYGKEQAYNAPISNNAVFAYTTALNALLSRESKNKFSINNRTFVFWASSDSEASKASESSLFAFLGKSDDNPNRNIAFVRDTFKSIYNGTLHSKKDDKFFILGLTPNAARIAVVYWAEIPLRDFAATINKHFDDMEIIDTRKDAKPYAGLFSMLSTIAIKGEMKNIAPNLPDAVVKSIFQGLPYPAALYQACIRRIRAEQTIYIARAAIIKAYLNRLNDNNKKLNIMLDKENQNQGYLCGRLFAVLDRIQEKANGIHSIRDRYMNAASSTPAAVFATILNLSSHHSEKLDAGKNIYFERIKQEIISKLDADGFPTHLDLQDQGRFFVGYYHQYQDFFTSKDNKEQE